MTRLVLPWILCFFCSFQLVAQSNLLNPLLLQELQAEILSLTAISERQIAPKTDIKPFKCEIFPIRVESSLQVVLPTTEYFTFRLVDIDGNVLFSHYQIFGENQVNLSHLEASQYFVEISSEKGKIIEEIIKT